jgi:hypothetical protein
MINIADSTVASSSPGIPAMNMINKTSVNLTRIEIVGRMFFGQGSNLVLQRNSVIDGNMICRAGSNANCVNPANVTGLTNCGLCPKP